MNFFSLALNNIKKKFGSYLIYLISAMFAVTIFSIFCSMYYNPQFSEYRFGAGKMAALFKASAVAVILFSSIFVFYANKFFIKTRKKEIAIYSLLGMKKNQIGRMLFYENILIGILAIAGGVFLGTILSRFFCMIALKLMKQIPKYAFSTQWEAVIVTIVAFIVLFTINSLNAYGTIYRYKLIELLSANKEGEIMPKFSVAGGILSVVLLAAGYTVSLKIDFNFGGIKALPAVFLVLILVVAGTVLFFSNFIPMMVVRLKNNKNYYYRPDNFISMSQIVYRIKANSRILSAIAVLSAVVVTMASSTYSMYRSFERTVPFHAPFSYMSCNVDDELYKKVLRTIEDTNEVKLISSDRFNLVKVQMHNPSYLLEDVNNPGKVFNKPGEAIDAYIISQSDYKSIIKNTNIKTGEFNNLKTNFNIDLKDGECYFIDRNERKKYAESIKGTIDVDFQQKTESYKITGVSMHKYIGALDMKPTVVLNDKNYKAYIEKTGKDDLRSFMGLMFDQPLKSEKTVAELNRIIPRNEEAYKVAGTLNFNYVEVNNKFFTLYGVYVFIGFFLGILFLLASGSIMYYKQLVEAQEEVSRYDILKKTGMNRKEIKRSIAKQLGVVFGMPLLVGLLHSFFSILTYSNVLDVMSQDNPVFLDTYMIIAIYVIIYLFYYVLSVSNYMRIVWDKK